MRYLSEENLEKFAKGARATRSERTYKTQKEWEKKGIFNFKRRVLGFCGKQSIKSLDELAEILMELKVIDSAKEGESFIEELYGKKAYYENGFLEFTKTQNEKGEDECKINGYNYYCSESL